MNGISVIVITKNNSCTIEECINSLLNQTYPKDKIELIFVDGHSEDGTDRVIKRYAEQNQSVRLFYENVGTMGYARNLGISKCKGDIIAFTDGDAIPPENWLEKISNSFEDANLMILGGMDQLVSSTETTKIIDFWRRQKEIHGLQAIPCIKTVNFAIRSNALRSSNGFDPTLSHLDEAELMARLYYDKGISRIVYNPNLTVDHKTTKSPSLRRRIMKVFDKTLNGTSVIMRKHMIKVALNSPMSTIGISFILALSVIASILGFLFSILLGYALNFLLLCSAFYVAALISYLAIMFQRTRKFFLSTCFILTVDLFIRYFGTIFGLVKWFQTFVKPKNTRNPLNMT